MSVGFCNPGNVGAHVFWRDQIEPSKSKRLVYAETVNLKLKLDHKHECRKCLLKTENREIVLL